MAPAIVTQIGTILGKPLHPAPARGEDLVSGVMPIRDAEPLRFAAQGDTLLGLNLAGAGLTDEQWRAITRLNGFRGADLQALNLRNNQLTESPLTAEMRNLHWLDLSNNQLREFTPPPGAMQHLDHLWLYGNPELGTPPPEIVAQGRYAVVHFLKELEVQGAEKLYEAKLVLVGDPKAGKTTLSRKLIDPEAPMPEEHETTKGVDVHIGRYKFKGRGDVEFTVNIWDFAGQKRYQPIHQFFYTFRALYVLVDDARTQSTDFDYWLQTVDLCSEGSPLMFVHNEKGDQSWGHFPLNEYQGRYGAWIKTDARVNLLENRGLPEVASEIEHQIQQLPHVGVALPKQWAAIRTELDALSRVEPYITFQRYIQICKNHGITDTEKALELSRYLHILGAMLHYADHKLLKQHVILRNKWATDAVYKILEDDTIVFVNKGVFNFSDLERVWADEDYASMQLQLLELMKKFKLCYQVRNLDMYIAPLLLPEKQQPEYKWNPAGDLHMTLKYKFMPMGLLTRFIVDRHTDIAEGQTLVWKNGVVLEWNNTRAEVREEYQVADGKIKIRVQGADRKGLLTIIDKTFEELHNDFKGIVNVEKLVPCNCPACSEVDARPNFYEWSDLMNRKEKGKKTVECKVSFEDVNVLQLIEYVFDQEERRIARMEEPSAVTKIFLSYSHANRAEADELKKFLAPYVNKNKIVFWYDPLIKPGADWEKEILGRLQESDIAILLLSADFWASNYIVKTELPAIKSLHDSKKIKVVPVYAKPHPIEETDWYYLQTIPQIEGRLTPVSSWSDTDEAWTAVVRKISEII